MLHATIQGEHVPALGLGTWQLRGDACREAVVHALGLGYRHIDTARMYDNEEAVGAGLRAADVDRDDVFLTTKVWRSDLAAADVRRAGEDSLRRLRLDYVDLLLIHWPNPDVPVEETLDAMLELREEGKIRHLGVSNFPPSLLKRAQAHTPVFCNQVEYQPYLSQERLLQLAREHDYLLAAYSPVARGKIKGDAVLTEIGKRHGKSTFQVALRWLVQQEKVCALPRSSSAEHRARNADIFDFELTDEEMTRIFGLARGDRLVNESWAPNWED